MTTKKSGPDGAPTPNRAEDPRHTRREKDHQGTHMPLEDSISLTGSTGTGQVAPNKFPVAFASAWAPSAGRRRWLAVYRCPRCGGGHAARAATLADLAGHRRGRCGRRVWVVIARTYGSDAR